MLYHPQDSRELEPVMWPLLRYWWNVVEMPVYTWYWDRIGTGSTWEASLIHGNEGLGNSSFPSFSLPSCEEEWSCSSSIPRQTIHFSTKGWLFNGQPWQGVSYPLPYEWRRRQDVGSFGRWFVDSHDYHWKEKPSKFPYVTNLKNTYRSP